LIILLSTAIVDLEAIAMPRKIVFAAIVGNLVSQSSCTTQSAKVLKKKKKKKKNEREREIICMYQVNSNLIGPADPVPLEKKEELCGGRDTPIEVLK
jgi:hypothetical protein